ncbi:hypothetical protein NIES4073_08070 [Kalymmatonema gypsitolerans NIES-4073]|nr:hypothetical protein NIES4073_08070 [Scytonema sp. NIES-4073]
MRGFAHRDAKIAMSQLRKHYFTNCRSPDSEATWYNFPYTEEGQRQMEEVFRRKINGEV